MDINAVVPGGGAILFGLLLILLALGIIGRSFTSPEFNDWLQKRRKFLGILGTILLLLGVYIIFWR